MMRTKEETKTAIKEAKKRKRRFRTFEHYKDECIRAENIHIKLLYQKLKEVD